jgi:hypothetical protein
MTPETTPITCWRCGAANDLETRQTCAVCGAPFERTGSRLRGPIAIGIGALLFAGWLCVFFWAVIAKACGFTH